MTFDDVPYAEGGEGWLGHNGAFRRDRMGMLQKLASSESPILRLRVPFPGVRVGTTADPAIIQEMLVEKGKHFDKSDMLRFSLYPLAGEGLFTSNGDLWRRQRRLMAPLFQPRVIEGYAPDMVAAAQRTVDEWQDGAERTLLHDTTRLTMAVAGKTLFDADTFSDADDIGRALTVALDWSGWVAGRPFAVLHIMGRRRFESLAQRAPAGVVRSLLEKASNAFRGPLVLFGERGRALHQAVVTLDERVQRMIDDRRKSPLERPDLMSSMLNARDEDGARMDDRQVRNEVLTLFVAGHETTATSLAWTVSLLCRHPEIYAAVQKEVDAIGPHPTVADLPRLQLTLRAFREALRLYPPVYLFGRDSRGDITVGGYRLPERTNILVSPWALHHNPKLWPDPTRFDPDRFLPEKEAARHRYAYLPFGAGPRVCIGSYFAYVEAQLALCVMLSQVSFELLSDDKPEPSATLRPNQGVRVKVKRRPT